MLLKELVLFSLEKKFLGLMFMKIYLRLKVPTLAEEQDALWEMTSDLSEITELDDNDISNNLKIICHIQRIIKIGFPFTMR